MSGGTLFPGGQPFLRHRICLFASCNQGCDLEIDTSNNSREMDAKKAAFLFIMNFQILVWTWEIKVKRCFFKGIF